jgi:YYY domain-containing protein
MIETLGWWLSLEVMGLITFPIVFLLFGGLRDRGYSVAKIAGMVFVGYAVWLGGFLGLLPFTRGAVILVLAVFAVGGLTLVGHNRDSFRAYLRERWRYVLMVETLFAAVFFIAAWLRSYVPDISGTEKPMEAALLSGLVRDSSLPAGDPWLSDHDMNYYHFGYLMMAGQIKLLGVGVNIGFNLALSTVVALGSVAAFGIVYNVLQASGGTGKKPAGSALGSRGVIVAGLSAVVLLFIYSNYEGVFEFLAIHGVDSSGLYDFVAVDQLDGPKESTSWYGSEHWWWWRASRLFWAPADCGAAGCPYVITEFPFFSFLLGDLHPHVLAIPFLLLIVALAWNLFVQENDLSWHWRSLPSALAMLILVGSIGFMHTINLPVVLLLLVAIYGFRQYWRHGSLDREGLISTGRFAAVLTLGMLIVYLPFYATYDSPTSGIQVTRGPDTRPFHLFLMWGLFLLLATAGALYAIARHRQGWRVTWNELAIAAAPSIASIMAWAVLAPLLISGPARTSGLGGWLTLLWLGVTLTLLLLGLLRTAGEGRKEKEADVVMPFALILAAVAVLVLVASELFYVKDVFDSRLNTVFKGWYIAWMLLGLATVLFAYVLLREWRPRAAWTKGALGVTAGVLVLAGLVYPLTATLNRTNGFDNPTTLDGLAFLTGNRRGEYNAIRWLNENVEGRPVVMEAIGGSFTDFGRVSAYTGLPTVLGWTGHEQQWRGSYVPQGTRFDDVETAYNTENAQVAQAVLDRYGVEFVYVGPVERQKYQPAALDKFRQFMDVAYENEQVTVYQRRGGTDVLVEAPR